MHNSGKLAGKTLFITGASRGIGKAIALKAARDGANIIIAAKSAEPHPKLPGTIYTAAKEVENAGGQALPCIVDVRDEKMVIAAVEAAVRRFGGIDILVNNASAISLTGTLHTDMKRFDLMHQINTRGTFLVSKICLPYLLKSSNPHILNISPPLNLAPHWFSHHAAYTMAKYGMSMCVLGMAEEFRGRVSVNALWPRTAVLTAAMEMLAGGSDEAARVSRKPEVMADAAYAILTKEGGFTGRFVTDEEVLVGEGVTDLTQYAVDPSNAHNLMVDGFLDVPPEDVAQVIKISTPEDLSSVLQAIKSTLNEDIVGQVQATYLIQVGEKKLYLDLKKGSGTLTEGSSGTPDVTLTLNGADFVDMFKGKIKPAEAFMKGKLKISGDLQKAMKLEKLMGKLRHKL